MGLNFELLPELFSKPTFLDFIESRTGIERRLLSEGRTTQSPAISARCQHLPSCHGFHAAYSIYCICSVSAKEEQQGAEPSPFTPRGRPACSKKLLVIMTNV
jgi:hypothetical protein